MIRADAGRIVRAEPVLNHLDARTRQAANHRHAHAGPEGRVVHAEFVVDRGPERRFDLHPQFVTPQFRDWRRRGRRSRPFAGHHDFLIHRLFCAGFLRARKAAATQP